MLLNVVIQAESSIRTRVDYKDWLSRIVKDEKAKRNAKIFELWMACHTQEEIAEKTKEPVGTINRLLGNGDDSLLQKVLENQTK